MNQSWSTRTDPVHHPVRFLASLWQKKMHERFGITKTEFTPQEYGQFKTLIKHLGELTPDVIDWSLDPANWWHFCQRAIPDRPEIGFLLQFRGHALQVMCASVQESPEWEEFVFKLEGKKSDDLRKLLLVLALDDPSPIDAATKNLSEMEALLCEMPDEKSAGSA